MLVLIMYALPSVKMQRTIVGVSHFRRSDGNTKTKVTKAVSKTDGLAFFICDPPPFKGSFKENTIFSRTLCFVASLSQAIIKEVSSKMVLLRVHGRCMETYEMKGYMLHRLNWFE